MTPRFLIDADCAIYAMDGTFPVLRARLKELTPGEAALSAISFAEVALGAALGKSPPASVFEAFLRAIPIAPFDGSAARAYARLPFKRARFDRLLAAHALSLGATVVTHNLNDFQDVPGLRVEDWTE